jgi:hypothetical protein
LRKRSKESAASGWTPKAVSSVDKSVVLKRLLEALEGRPSDALRV